MLVESHTLQPSSKYPLFITAKRYWIPEFERNVSNPSAQTLIILHSTSFHKESWEPALEDLFRLASQQGSKSLIREAWAIDCPNHGESANLNHRVLTEPSFANFSCEKYAEAVRRFLSAGPNHGAHVDFSKRNLVGIGHSLGANAILILQNIQPIPTFSMLIIVEPMVSAKGHEPLDSLRDKLVESAKKRQALWPSREHLKTSFMKPKHSAAKWDPRVLDAFAEHALGWNPELKGFSLRCTPQQEVAMYLDVEGVIKPVEALNKVCHITSVHLILGEVSDFIPHKVQQALIDPTSGRRFASLNILTNVGHLVPQEAPALLASHIFNALSVPRSSRL
ncbi:hypothetical protein M413DRAFT_444334 [Hebeloma cylindrosporum]|uniref:AB hydrolase-1 domain-containing protein n=1 Tax=Hebeloma cylindrosporum TaxID=76867 RepID=A0A0C3CEN9_HEBCY|nr:hypothetical protein M413DRAFT_444334 [Hebeloma cylindrosporum h7]